VTELQRFQDKQWSLIVAKAWSDDEFKGLLLSNPQAVLREHGIDAPDDVRVNVVDDSDMMSYLTLPPSPTSDLFEEDLTPVGVAYCYSGGCHRCWRCGCGCGGCGFCGACAAS